MSDLNNLQQQFFGCLLTDQADLASKPMADLVTDDGIGRDVGLGIYRNAYSVRLIEVLRTDHEILDKYIGHQAFDDLARAYIAAHPSQYRSLRQFGDNLPSFLANEEPYSELSQLSDLAAFERALLNVFDAADAPCLDVADLQAIPQHAWPELTLEFHPSLLFFSARTNCVPIWQHLKEDKTPPDVERTNRDGVWLAWRNRARISEFKWLEGIEYQLLTLFQQGHNLATVCEMCTVDLPQENIIQAVFESLSDWCAAGLVASNNAEPGSSYY